MATANPVTFLKEVRSELSKVVWPTRPETIKLTIMVIIVSTVVGAFIGGLDVLFVKLTSLLIK
jgi:preprotein translocase subunit SecE